MSDASKAKLMMEQGQTFTAMTAMTDSGDLTTLTSGETLWSRADGKTPSILVNGLKSGGAVTVGSGNDNVSGAAAIVVLNGVDDVSVTADTSLAITRSTGAYCRINSITVDNSGAYAVVAGTDSTATSFSETRGSAAGPPYIPVDSIEIAQVRTTDDTAAPILATEIFQVINTHLEKADYPLYDIDYEAGTVTFDSALPAIHTGDEAKAVYNSSYSAILVELKKCSDFVMPENTHSVSSEQVYNGTIGSSSSSLGQGGFTQRLEDGVNDSVVTFKDQILWFKFFPDRNKTAYTLAQGKLGVARTFPAGAQIQAACTISAESEGTEHSA